ncbi:GntR family transcriptional regulator [Leucobacter sp. wl10]|uniref:GntR family transcriptional regulator n=1 Tax=Leucobacter sp. wl10 TaxID=2304677 RepID=UPI000E5B0183|nr:GntR family transcriptional regulator [Leucobacter sp. wl10]RGE15850.1 GntR family transcriptional regulator [Leucobacter sp. wl10]
MTIQRFRLRDQVRDELLKRMREGQVQPGANINEIELAKELGVSRTPVREALIGLACMGQLTLEDGKGFRFTPLSSAELRNLAPIIATLETLALRLSDGDALKRIGEELVERALQLKDGSIPPQLLRAKDDEWHNLMISACPNQELHKMIEGARQSYHRYEAPMFSDHSSVAVKVGDEHVTIARSLITGDVEAASRAIEANWRLSAELLTQYLDGPYSKATAQD